MGQDLDERESGARGVLERFRQAAISQSADDLSRVYAVDAVHEFPFTGPGLPSRLEGRDEIMRWTVAMWETNTFTYERYRTLAIHDTGDPNTIIVEQEAIGTGSATSGFVLPNIVVLTARDGQVVRLRDYVDVLAATAVVQAQP
jgi:uncharacterized protein